MSLFGKLLSYDDYKKEDGSIDWNAYRKAEIANGDLCYQCGGSARLLGGPGHRVLCGSCERLSTRLNEEVDHASRIRCPKCGYVHVVDGDWDHYEIFAEGEHSLTCSECNHDFTIETHVSYSFTSPPRLDEKQEAADADPAD